MAWSKKASHPLWREAVYADSCKELWRTANFGIFGTVIEGTGLKTYNDGIIIESAKLLVLNDLFSEFACAASR